MFGSNRTSPPAISNYAEAVAVYDKIKPVRGRDPNERPLAGRSNWNLTIRTNSEEDIVVKLYHTDVVIYKKDGHILLEPYGSRLTNEVVWGLLYRTGIRLMWKNTYNTPAFFTRVGGQYYHTPSYVDIFDGQLVGGAKPVEIPRVDRKALNAALKHYRFGEFEMWLKASDKLNVLEAMKPDTPEWKYRKPPPSTVISLLEAGPEGWRTLVTEHTHRDTNVSNITTLAREIVVRFEGCIRFETVQSFGSEREVNNALRAFRRFS